MPVSATDLLQEGLAAHRRGAVAEAAARYGEVLRADPGNADAHYYLGMMSCQQGRFAEGAASAGQALAADPRHVRAQVLLGRAMNALGQHEEALASFDRAIALAPDFAQAHGHRADVLSVLNRNGEAVESYDRALALAPDATEDWFNRAIALVAVGRLHDALSSFDRVIAARPDFAEARLRRAKVLSDLGRRQDALQHIDEVLTTAPGLATAWLGRGNILTALNRYDEAFAAFGRALTLDRNLAGAWLGRGNALAEIGRDEEALAAYEAALAVKPAYAEALLGCGTIFGKRGQNQEALAAYDSALAAKPGLAEAWFARGTLLTQVQRLDEAFAAYDQAVALNVDLSGAIGARYIAKLFLCDWSNIETETAQLLATVRAGKLSSPPFSLLAAPSSPQDQLRCARRAIEYQPNFAPLWQGEAYSHDRIRVAYLSADFREHPMAHLIVGMLERHDKSRFEITGISFGPSQDSPIRRRIKGACEHFLDVQKNNDEAVADLVRRHEIDIAIDLMGFTTNSRPNVTARRPAPIQVSYLGFPATMGAPYIDYVLADATVVPREHIDFYSEKVAWLPDSYYVNDNRGYTSERVPTRSECGLPDKAFVFCCFNNAYKITLEIFEIWMRLMRARQESVLWLLEANAKASENLRAEAEKRGVSSQRLKFASRVAAADHLARHQHADLFLDTLPYNAHTTACDALWTGVPVVTCMGSAFAGRVAASLLRAAGLNELVTTSLGDYEALALKLASDSALLASLKARLASTRPTCALFDTDRFRRHVEQAYARMVEMQRRGDKPVSFSVDPTDGAGGEQLSD